MAKRRHGMNPAKVKADLEAMEDQAPAELTQRSLRVRRRLSIVLMCLLTAVLLMASFPPFDAWCLAYVALVPLVLALAGSTHPRWAVLWAFLAGVVFWSVTLYWLWWVLLLSWDSSFGFIALVLYLSLYWLAAAWVLRAALRRDMPMWLVLPAVWAALEYARAHIISGFPWFNLAMSQYARTRLIQVADVTGQYGVSFFVAMVNGTIADLLAAPLFRKSAAGLRLSRRFGRGLAACGIALALLLGYGTYRLNQNAQAPGPVVGVVQQSFPIWLDEGCVPSAEVLAAHVEATRANLARAGCDVIVWPETMLPRGINREMLLLDSSKLSEMELRRVVAMFHSETDKMDLRQLRFLFDSTVNGMTVGQLRRSEHFLLFRKDFQQELAGRGDSEVLSVGLRQQAESVAQASRLADCPILAGGVSVQPNPKPLLAGDDWLNYNSAMVFDRDWQDSQRYSKVKLVPFSEYVPLRDSWPWLHKVLRSFVPPVMDQLTPGKEYTLLSLPRRAAEDGTHGRSAPAGTAPAAASAPASIGPAGSSAGAGGGGERPAWKLATPICYEGTFPEVCRQMVYQNGRKAADLLVNISNDGWFVWKWGKWRGQGSTEQAQHLSHYVFRAIENRVPVVRAVNTGISASIDSNGRIVTEIRQQNTRTAIAGSMVLGGQPHPGEPPALRRPGILVDGRVSLYSSSGDLFAILVSVCAAGLAAWLAWKRRPKEGDGHGA